MPAVEIRPAKENDIPQLVRLDHSYTTDHVWQMDFEIGEEQFTATFRRVRLPRAVRVDYPRSPRKLTEDWFNRAGLLIAAVEGEIVGYASLTVESVPQTIRLTDLTVTSGMRRRGIASALVLASLEWTATQPHHRRLVVEMQPKNDPAISLALKLGFDFCGYADHHFPNGDTALFFTKWVR